MIKDSEATTTKLDGDTIGSAQRLVSNESLSDHNDALTETVDRFLALYSPKEPRPKTVSYGETVGGIKLDNDYIPVSKDEMQKFENDQQEAKSILADSDVDTILIEILKRPQTLDVALRLADSVGFDSLDAATIDAIGERVSDELTSRESSNTYIDRPLMSRLGLFPNLDRVELAEKLLSRTTDKYGHRRNHEALGVINYIDQFPDFDINSVADIVIDYWLHGGHDPHHAIGKEAKESLLPRLSHDNIMNLATTLIKRNSTEYVSRELVAGHIERFTDDDKRELATLLKQKREEQLQKQLAATIMKQEKPQRH